LTTYTKTENDTSLNLKADKATTYTKTENNTLLANKLNITDFTTGLSYYYTKDAADIVLSSKVNTSSMLNYYNKSENNTLLNLKANTTALTNYYTKTENDSNLEVVRSSLLNGITTAVQTKVDTSLYTSNISAIQTRNDTADIAISDLMIDYPAEAIYDQDDGDMITRTLVMFSYTGIVISGSSFTNDGTLNRETNYSPYMAFNKFYTMANTGNRYEYDNEYGWVSAPSFNPKIDFGSQIYQTNISGSMVGRQWLNIECPTPMAFSGFKMYCRLDNAEDRPRTYHVCGSDNNSYFKSLYYVANETYHVDGSVKRIFAYPSSYKYYRIVIVNTDTSSTDTRNHSVNIQEMMFFTPPDHATYALNNRVNSLYVFQEKLVNLLEKWIKNNQLVIDGLAYSQRPILEHM
jgi:hypothetical protein